MLKIAITRKTRLPANRAGQKSCNGFDSKQQSCAQTHIHAMTHAHASTNESARARTHTRENTHTHPRTHGPPHTHTRARAHARAHKLKHKLTHKLTRTRSRTRARAHELVHAQPDSWRRELVRAHELMRLRMGSVAVGYSTRTGPTAGNLARAGRGYAQPRGAHPYRCYVCDVHGRSVSTLIGASLHL
jgi:hypothetical protein